MTRIVMLILIGSFGAPALRASELPTIPPAEPGTPITLPGTLVPASPSVATMYPTPSLPTAPTISSHACTACEVDPCAPQPGLFRRLMARLLARPEPCSTCDTPMVKGVWYPAPAVTEPLPATSSWLSRPVVSRPGLSRPILTRPMLARPAGWHSSVATNTSCESCGAPAARPALGGHLMTGTKGSAKERLKAWLGWKPCQEQYLPRFVPTQYSVPARAYMPITTEPTRGLECGSSGKHGRAGLGGATCNGGTCAAAGSGSPYCFQPSSSAVILPCTYPWTNGVMANSPQQPSNSAILPAGHTTAGSVPSNKKPLSNP